MHILGHVYWYMCIQSAWLLRPVSPPPQMAALESQSSRDATIIGKLNSEIWRITVSIGEHNAELTKLQRLVG